MGRTLCVWFPDWPLRRPDALPDSPCQVVDDGQRVVAANTAARQSGVLPGMRRREAEALCPDALTLTRDPGAEAAAFEVAVTAVEDLVPAVEVAEPGLLFVPVAGAIRYYGGEAPLARLVAARLVEVVGSGARLGISDGPFTAHWAARLASDGEPHIVDDDAAFLASLDVSTLGTEELVATFRWLGIVTLGELAELPRAAVVSRFGPAGLRAHRLASGEDRRPRPRHPEADPAVEDRYDEPLTTLEQSGFAARSLAHRLMTALRGSGAAPHRVEIQAEAAGGGARTRIWRSSDPFDEAMLAERVWWQLRAWIDGGGVPGGVTRIRLAPADLSDRGRQLALLDDAVADEEARRAVARAQALVGPDRVLQARPQGGRRPADRVLWQRWDESVPSPARDPDAPWPGRVPDPAPTLIPPARPRLEVEWDGGMPTRVRLGSRWVEVLNWAGPWRRLGRWWDGEASVDRYQLVTSAGALLCEIEDGATYLAGIYD